MEWPRTLFPVTERYGRTKDIQMEGQDSGPVRERDGLESEEVGGEGGRRYEWGYIK